MRKLWIGIFLLASSIGWVWGQSVTFYRFAADTVGGPYMPLSGGTTVQPATTVKGENFKSTFFNETEALLYVKDTSMEGIRIGFDFSYIGKTFDKFLVSGNGYILLGEKGMEKIPMVGMVNQMYPHIGVMADGKTFGVEGTKVAYKTEGESPNRTLTVEYSNMAYSEEAVSEQLFNFQIKLYEENGNIEILFDEFVVPQENGTWGVGINQKGRMGSTCHYRRPLNGNWCQTEYNANSVYFVEGSRFKEGLKYVFSKPETCEKPTREIAGIDLSAGSDRMIIDVKIDTGGQGEDYIVFASESPIPENFDGKEFYEDEEFDGITVLKRGVVDELDFAEWDPYQTPTSFRVVHNGLKPNTTYYYAAAVFNYRCTNTAYSALVKKQGKTRTTSPASLVLDEVGLDHVKFSVEKNDLNQEVLVAMTTVRGKDEIGNIALVGDFGTPSFDAEVGDTIRKEDGSFGGLVLYVGPASEDLVYEGKLLDNRIYHFGAFSKGEDAYSSSFAQADTLSPALIPFESRFGEMVADIPPLGWNGTKGFIVPYGAGKVQASVEGEEGVGTEVILALPPLDFPEDADVDLELSYSLNPYSYKLAEKDSINFEVSTDGGKTYDIVKAVTMNSPASYLRDVPVTGYEGKKQVLVRMRHVSFSGELHDLIVSKFNVRVLPYCDLPTDVYVNSVFSDKANVSWTPSLREEKAWNVSYSLKGEDGSFADWSEPVNVSEKSCQISGLFKQRVYGVRVRAVCGVGLESDWTEIKEFKSGFSPSFIENFDALNVYENQYTPGDTIVDLPEGWGDRHGFSYPEPESVPDTVRSQNIGYFYGDESFYVWKTDRFPKPGVSDGSMSFRMNNLKYEMIQVPSFELDGKGDPVFRMKMAYGNMTEDGLFETVESTQESYRFHVLISMDGGKTYVLKNGLGSWKGNELAGIGEENWFEADLSQYQGHISLMFLVEGVENLENANHILYIDSVGVVNQCAVARLLRVKDVTSNSAKVVWDEELTVDEWIVKVDDGLKSTLAVTGESGFSLTGLLPATAYAVSVAHLCGTDTSDWSKVEFVTGGEECDPITQVTVTEITRQSARLTWEGSASDYRIRLRPVSDKPGAWTYFMVEDAKTFVLKPLLKLTKYEGGIQSVCGMAAGDTSEYVDFEEFTTLDLTCFPPYDLVAKALDHQSASIAWKGDADRYQVEWYKKFSEEALGNLVVEGKEAEVKGLQPETNYQVRVRSICSAGDTSEWSDYAVFETGIMPPCPAPTNLRVESVTAHSATLLWDTEEETNFFILRYRTTVSTWDSVNGLEEKSYELTGLEPKTAYIWSVMNQCADGRYSGWGAQSRFETEGEVSNESGDKAGLFITTSRNQIHLMNPSAVQIDRVRIYGMEGGLLEDYVVRSNENIILTTAESMRVVVVVVESEGETYRFKTLLP